MTPESIQRYFSYSFWVFERVWDCIMTLDDTQFTQTIGYSVGSIRNQIVHLISAEQRWMYRLATAVDSDMPEHLNDEAFPTRVAAKAKWDVHRLVLGAYVAGFTQEQLDDTVTVHFPHRNNLSMCHKRWEFLLHVGNHATDHRAQILAMLHQYFGANTVEQDMFFYLIENA